MIARSRGNVEIRRVSELDRWTFRASDLFPQITEHELRAASAILGDRFFDQQSHAIVLAIHTYVVRIGTTTVLVDTGNGNGRDRPNLVAHHMFETDYLERLRAARIQPDDVDLVICTHLHPDHCGWNTTLRSGTWRPTFPRAEYLFHRPEFEAMRDLVIGGADNGVQADLIRMWNDSVQPVLDEGRWGLIDTDCVLAAEGDAVITARTAPGHTTGHLIIDIDEAGGGSILCGDVIHHPLQLLFPYLSQGGDSDPSQAAETRAALLRRCIHEGKTMLTAHFPAGVEVSFDSQENTYTCLGDNHSEARASRAQNQLLIG
ncbi:MBL fold metallo-hydrolase [Nocardia sp. NBC_00508]|uniref:MBL fold metallo-hydrolase n=1 Tax=Nocardia sp. NBC_00508 TaxID=2975992 RepID=UPI002E7FC07E|nr:MBL fold metallo-hydrolase [Nocardia sp. NBC_00508]WUD65178.1 MBL fold metallo-hydrolase [Nocardia sp. NBC_00508]